MKLQALLALALILATTTMTPGAQPEDAAQKALSDARAFARAGDYAKALERHEWFHKNALAIRPSYYGVRLSFALSDWKRLGEKYPPAMASLKATRDAGLAALDAGTAPAEVFHDVASINRELGEAESTIVLFKKLHTQRPELAKKCFRAVQETLLERGETDLFVHYVGDLPAYMQGQLERYRSVAAMIKSRSDPSSVRSIKRFEDQMVQTALKLIQIATDRKDSTAAGKIRQMTSAEVNDPRLNAAAP